MLASLLDEFVHVNELPTVPEQVAQLCFSIFRIGIRVQVTGSVDLFSIRQFGGPLLPRFVIATVPGVVPITVLPIISSVVVPIILPIRVPCGYQVVVIIVAVLPPLVAIPSATRVVLRLIIVFVVTALSWPSHVVLAISPAVGDFH